MDEMIWRLKVFVGTGAFGIGAAAGFPMGFLAAILLTQGVR